MGEEYTTFWGLSLRWCKYLEIVGWTTSRPGVFVHELICLFYYCSKYRFNFPLAQTISQRPLFLQVRPQKW